MIEAEVIDSISLAAVPGGESALGLIREVCVDVEIGVWPPATLVTWPPKWQRPSPSPRAVLGMIFETQ